MAFYAYVAVGGENKILIFQMDRETGELRDRREVALGGGAGPLAVDPEQRFMYVGIRSTREMASFRIDSGTGGLSHFGAVSLSSDPCYMATDRRGRFVLSAYYGAGKATVHAIGGDGAVAGQVAEVLTATHAHCIRTDASNRFAFVPHTMPANAIFQFLFDENTGALTPNAVPQMVAEAGAGPRHFTFHPGRDTLYTSNENGSSATAYRFDPKAGTLAAFQTVPTLPEGFEGNNTCAKIYIHPSGRFLYVSNRGHDSIACFSVDEGTGALTPLGQQKTEQTPRAFNIDPTGNFLFAAGQESGQMEAFRIDPRSGRLEPLAVYPVGKQAAWVLILEV